MHQHHKGTADDADERDVADEIEIEVVVERRVDGGGRVGPKQRIAVGGSTHDGLGGDIAGGAGPVLDDEWLAEPLGERLTQQAYENVRSAAGGISDDPCAPAGTDRLAPWRCATHRERGSARCQMQKLSPWNFHRSPPPI